MSKVSSKDKIKSCDEETVQFADSINGLILSNALIPEEVVITILSYVPWVELPSCRLVCGTWKELIETSVSYKKLKENYKHCRANSVAGRNVPNFSCLPFYINYAIGTFKFGKNLIKNSFGYGGSNKFKHWKIVESNGDGWEVETEPCGSDPLPEELDSKSCFVTSYISCHKEQLIKLEKHGLHSKIMDEVQPDIEVSEWYAARFDCGIKYRIRVCLLNDKKEPVVVFEDGKMLAPSREWHKISHTFTDYGRGIRYVLFGHGGTDTQFWAGHYGSKMAGASVLARVPDRVLNTSSNSD